MEKSLNEGMNDRMTECLRLVVDGLKRSGGGMLVI